MRKANNRTIALLAIIAFAACASAAQLALAAGSPAPPRAGTWKLTPSGAEAGLISGGLTVTTGRKASDVHAKLSRTTLGQGIRQWVVGSGRNPSGGVASTPVDLTIDGTKQVNATLTIAFPSKSERGAGELNWGPIEGGIQACGVAYYVVAG